MTRKRCTVEKTENSSKYYYIKQLKINYDTNTKMLLGKND